MGTAGKSFIIFFLLQLPLFLQLRTEVADSYPVAHSKTAVQPDTLPPPFLVDEHSKWVDSVMKKLTPDERIGQLFMMAAWSGKSQRNESDVVKLIATNKIGGLIFMQGGPVQEAQLINKYQQLSKVPLLMAMDAEWGLQMRLDSTIQFPREMTMGAMQSPAGDSLIYKMGLEMARECKRLGVQVSFSPVADVNNNPANPVIGTRSFGENKFSVAQKALLYMKGLQDGGVLACGKHFPGHGDVTADSHKTLPVITKSKDELDSLELYPFRQLITKGLGSMMVAHLYVPAYDTTTNLATTLSKNVVTDLLKNQLGFKGLVFTDALNMKGVTKYFAPGDVDVKALLAGNDMLLFSGDVPKAIKLIKEAIANGDITQDEIDARCRKILAVKQWCGLDKKKKTKMPDLAADLNTPSAQLLCRQIAEKAVTVLKNDRNLLPLTHLDTLNIASVCAGTDTLTPFQQRIGFYAPVKFFNISRSGKQKAERDSLLAKLQPYNLVILSLQHLSQYASKNFGITDNDEFLMDTLKKLGKKVVLDVFGPPYALNSIPGNSNCDAVLMSYEDLDYMQDISAQVIFGGISSSGKLPVTTNDWKYGSGISTPAPIRFKYTLPEEVGFSRTALARIDSIISDAMKQKAFPGCQLLIARNGKVFVLNSYGNFTYDNTRPVQNTDLYDIASVTKIMATLPVVMQYVDAGKMNLDDSLVKYLPELKGTNKQNIVLRQMLAHQAGLQAWVPFYLHTLNKDDSWKPGYYRKTFSDSFPVYVAPGMFLKKDFHDSLYAMITASPVSNEHKYLYSDLGYYYLKKIIERNERMLLSDFVMKTFYRPLGLSTMGYQPRLRFSSSVCAPTENDTKWRKQQVQGDVHDQGAAMLGGIGGHAGVFSDANDVGVMMQLYLNGGTYGGTRFFDSATVHAFTKYQFPKNGNRRGIGFDKPEMDPKKPNPACDSISGASFGHQGFTGTQAWADPQTGMVFVFLSNRVYPDTDPNKLAKMGIRSLIMQVIVEEMKRNSK